MAGVRDVAKLAGVSISTVSRYLNGQSLKEDTTKRIAAAVQELDYKENLIAKGLKNNRSFSVGLLMNSISSRFGSEVVSGIEKVVEKNGYSLLLSGFSNEPSLIDRKIDYLMKHSVDGLIIFLAGEEWAGTEKLAKAKIPMVLLNHPNTCDNADTILINDRHSVHQVITHYIRSGHEKIGIIAAPQSDYAARERLLGAQAAIAQEGVGDLSIYIGDYSRKSGFEGAQKLLKQGITALFVCNYNMSIGALECFNQNRVRVHQDIAFGHYDYSDEGEAAPITQITITPPANQIGEKAAELLLKRISASDKIPEQVYTLESEISGLNDK